MERTKPVNKTVDGYSSFIQARNRCRNPKSKVYKYYGGRGIEFRFDSFEDFYAHIGPRPSRKHSLERIDNEGHYEKGNVRWATATEQAQNTVNHYPLNRFALRYGTPALHRFLGIGRYSE
jgi:hypothetical protein